jgi:sortase A
VAFAGHRTTYGHPFNRIDELEPGDPILVTTTAGVTYRYEMTEQKKVTPDHIEVLDDTPDNRLTLTTCHPKYSAEQRLIVTAKLVTPLAPAPPAAADATPPPPRRSQLASSDESAGLSGARTAQRPAVAWAILAASVWLAAWALGRWSGRRWTAYLVGAPIFLVLLFMFFENFARLLPANV